MITWFKELFMLIGMLFSRIDKNSDLKVITTKNFPFEGYAYMMWCGSVITRKNHIEMDRFSYNHERGHLMQASFYKNWISYYLVYLWEWLKGGPIMNPASAAYYTIPFEVQAYANQENSDYDYNREDLKQKYTLKNRKKTYIEHRDYWYSWIKGL